MYQLAKGQSSILSFHIEIALREALGQQRGDLVGGALDSPASSPSMILYGHANTLHYMRTDIQVLCQPVKPYANTG